MKRSGVILVGIALLSQGCGSDDKSVAYNSSALTGKWESAFQDGKGLCVYEFKDDGTFEVETTLKWSKGKILGQDAGTWTYGSNRLKMKPTSSTSQVYEGDVLTKELPGPTQLVDAEIKWFGTDRFMMTTTTGDSAVLERVTE